MYKIVLLKQKFKDVYFFGYCKVNKDLISDIYKLEKKGTYLLVGNKGDQHKAIIYHGKEHSFIDKVWLDFTITDPKVYVFESENKIPTLVN